MHFVKAGYSKGKFNKTLAVSNTNELMRQLRNLYHMSRSYDQLHLFLSFYEFIENHCYVHHFVSCIIKSNKSYFEHLYETENNINFLNSQMEKLSICNAEPMSLKSTKTSIKLIKKDFEEKLEEELEEKLKKELDELTTQFKTLTINPPQYTVEKMTQMMKLLKI